MLSSHCVGRLRGFERRGLSWLRVDRLVARPTDRGDLVRLLQNGSQLFRSLRLVASGFFFIDWPSTIQATRAAATRAIRVRRLTWRIAPWIIHLRTVVVARFEVRVVFAG